MPRWAKGAVWFLAACVALAGAAAFYLYASFSGWCASTPIASLALEGTDLQAVLYERNCGATTPIATHVSILQIGEEPDRAGNVFIADGNHGQAATGPWGGPWAEIEWQAPTQLVVRYASRARVVLSEPQVDGIDVSFEPVAR